VGGEASSVLHLQQSLPKVFPQGIAQNFFDGETLKKSAACFPGLNRLLKNPEVG